MMYKIPMIGEEDRTYMYTNDMMALKNTALDIDWAVVLENLEDYK